MTKNHSYTYILEDYAYSDFEYYILSHEKQYTQKEFKEIIKKAMIKTNKTCPYGIVYLRHQALFDILKKEYGFHDAEETTPIIHLDDLRRELKNKKGEKK